MSKKKTLPKYVIPASKEEVIDGITITTYGTETIDSENVADSAEEYIKLFGANKNLYRVIPSLQDGLKPGPRRLLYSWWLANGRIQSTDKESLSRLKFYKADIRSSETMSFHPHSDSGIEGTLGRFAQPFANNVCFVYTEGSVGNLQFAKPAAGRYLDVKLTPFTIDCFFDGFDNYCIPTKLAYDGEKYEPEILPAKYPVILFNPQFSGIGIGMSSNIPPFNVKEVLEATISLIKDPTKKILLIPDIPTGADVIDTGEFDKMNNKKTENGETKLVMQASYEIDYKANTIHITSIPLNTKTKFIIQAIIDIKKQSKTKEFDDIVAIDDRTQFDAVDMLIKLKPDANPDKIIKHLFKKNTGLKSTKPVDLIVIDDYRDYHFCVRDLLLEWIEWRKDEVLSMMLNKLQILSEKEHYVNAMIDLIKSKHIDDAVKIAKNSSNNKEAVEKIMSKFGYTSIQADAITDMKVRGFTKEAYDRYVSQLKTIKEELDEVNKVLKSDKNLDEYIIKQLQEGIEKYGEPRRSKVIRPNDKGTKNIPDEDFLLGISESGYVKKVSSKKNNAIGVISEDNSPVSVLQINSREDILIVDDNANICRIPVSSIPETTFDKYGEQISKMFPVRGNVKAIMELPSSDILKAKDDDICLLVITEKGIAKKVPLSEFKKLTRSKPVIPLDKDDKLAYAAFVFHETSRDVIICTNEGNGIRLPMSEFRTYGAAAKGLSMITLQGNERVSNLAFIKPNKKMLFYITTSGKGKLTELKYFDVMKRNDVTLPLITLTKRESLIGIGSVNLSDKVVIYTEKNGPVEINLSNIPVKARKSSGENLNILDGKDKVTGFRIFK